MVARPKAAEVDQNKDPVKTPAAKYPPKRRPWFIDVPAIARVAGPGLAMAAIADTTISE